MTLVYAQSERMGPERYHFRMSMLHLRQYDTLMPDDTFRFTIRVLSRSNHLSINENPTLLLYCPSQSISCQNFFQEGQVFLRTLLTCSHFSIEPLDEILDGVISVVRELFNFNNDASHPLESNQHQDIHLWLVITLFDGNRLHAVTEESIQDFRMIPASQEAIQTSLKETKITRQNESCSICLEHMDVNAEGYSTMPCNHWFHQQCIVTWLQTNHVCPLCRYPLPTINNS